jgi:hypothetical protein
MKNEKRSITLEEIRALRREPIREVLEFLHNQPISYKKDYRAIVYFPENREPEIPYVIVDLIDMKNPERRIQTAGKVYSISDIFAMFQDCKEDIDRFGGMN